jgi:hypothetical protein
MTRMSMHHVRDCVRLKNAAMTTQEIARRIGVVRTELAGESMRRNKAKQSRKGCPNLVRDVRKSTCQKDR